MLATSLRRTAAFTPAGVGKDDGGTIKRSTCFREGEGEGGGGSEGESAHEDDTESEISTETESDSDSEAGPRRPPRTESEREKARAKALRHLPNPDLDLGARTMMVTVENKVTGALGQVVVSIGPRDTDHVIKVKVCDATGIPPRHQRLVVGREGEELNFAYERGTSSRNEPDAEAWRLRQELNRRDRRVWARLHYAKQKKRKSMALEEAARYVYYRDQVHRMFR